MIGIDNTCMNKRDIKDVLADLMKLRDVKQVYLSEQSGVPQPTISRILRGTHSTLEIDTARKLADFFQISIDQMIGNEPLDIDPQWFEVKRMWKGFESYKKNAAIGSLRGLAESSAPYSPTQNTVDRSKSETLKSDKPQERRSGPAKGPQARAWGYFEGENIRSGDLMPGDQTAGRRKKNG